MSEPILSAEDLHKSYDLGRRLIEVLQGVSLEIGEGEFLSLQGASGTGKSTLLHLLGGLLHRLGGALEGRVRRRGRRVEVLARGAQHEPLGGLGADLVVRRVRAEVVGGEAELAGEEQRLRIERKLRSEGHAGNGNESHL